jgi:2-polyprenyl-6-methoxyphenol hydroxylase-like FAD-dependent oxidoreductase
VFENDPNVTFTQGVTLTNITEDTDSVTITYEDDTGTKKSSKVLTLLNSLIQGKFLVGADGKVGYVRKHYLEPKGVKQVDSEK